MRDKIMLWLGKHLQLISVSQLAKESGVPQSTLDKYIKGKSDLKVEQLVKLMDCLGLEIFISKKVDSKKDEDLL